MWADLHQLSPGMRGSSNTHCASRLAEKRRLSRGQPLLMPMPTTPASWAGHPVMERYARCVYTWPISPSTVRHDIRANKTTGTRLTASSLLVATNVSLILGVVRPGLQPDRPPPSLRPLTSHTPLHTPSATSPQYTDLPRRVAQEAGNRRALSSSRSAKLRTGS